MRISVVIIGVTDMQRAVRFYQKALELPPKFQSAEYTEFATPGAALALEKRATAVLMAHRSQYKPRTLPGVTNS
jgi:catechol 2,3-dioxygenase-like lactoylglutathione lyase family enzyme